MKERIALLGWILTIAFPSLLAAHVDGMSLSVSPGTGPGQVNLDWTGGQPAFQIYRSNTAANVVSPVNLIGQSPVRAWSDTPGVGNLFFYMITSPCVYSPPEICDGQDNNCDGTIDEPGAELSCNLPNASAVCLGGACAVGACALGFGDCDGFASDGCENDLQAIPNCGACGQSCDDSNSCTAETCVARSCRQIDQRACTAAPTSGAAGVSCATLPSQSGCWGQSCSAEVIPLPAGCANPDGDGDGLSDKWEDSGWIDRNCDGVQDSGDATIPDSNKEIADIYLKASAMASTSTEVVDVHVPSDEAVKRAVAMFAGSHLNTPPVRCDASSPCPPGNFCSDFVCLPACTTDLDCAAATDGGKCAGGVCRRRRLHLDHAEINIIPHVSVLFFGPPVPGCLTGGDVTQGVNFYDLKANPANFDPKGKFFKHYMIFGHFQSCDSTGTCFSPLCPASPDDPDHQANSGNSGLAEIMGNDGMVTLGAFAYEGPAMKDMRDSGAMLHELGHNLGLHHGGPDCPTPPCPGNPDQDRKVNYLSVMNRLYNFGIPIADVPGSTTPIPGVLQPDYSHFELPPLDEANLDEPPGVSPGDPPPFDRYLIQYYAPPATQVPRYGSTMPGQPIDWNFNFLLETGVSVDLNNNGFIERHSGAEDWSHLKLTFQCSPNFQD